LIKSADKTVIQPGGVVTYTYVVMNNSANTITSITVKDDNGTPNDPGDDFVVGTIASLSSGASQTFTKTVTVPMPMCMNINGVSKQVGTLQTTILPNGNVDVVYRQSRSLVDNTYGTGAVGWPSGHTFNDLLGSDKAQFVFYNSAGTKVLDVYADYVSAASTSMYPSGYGTLGVTGGDGGVNYGSASSVVSVKTTITTDLNQGSAFYGYKVNSPLPESSFPTWDYVDGYELVILGSTFGASGFGHVDVPLVHNSPSKLGFNAATPSPCGACVTNTATVSGNAGTLLVTSSAKASVCFGNPPPPLALACASGTALCAPPPDHG
jgi:hypothetical protein